MEWGCKRGGKTEHWGIYDMNFKCKQLIFPWRSTEQSYQSGWRDSSVKTPQSITHKVKIYLQKHRGFHWNLACWLEMLNNLQVSAVLPMPGRNANSCTAMCCSVTLISLFSHNNLTFPVTGAQNWFFWVSELRVIEWQHLSQRWSAAEVVCVVQS